MLPATTAVVHAPQTQRSSVQFTLSFIVNATPARVFDLVTPEGERRWAPGWNPRYLTDAHNEAGTVFETGGVNHRRVWVLDQLDAANGHIRYTSVRPDREVLTIDVTVRAEGRGSRVQVRHDIVSLSTQNDENVRDSVPDVAAESEHWRQAFEAALAGQAQP